MWCLCETFSCVISWLKEWQTFVTGMLAVLAATVAAALVGVQIFADHRRAESQRKRKAAALRARMPLDLDDVRQYARDYFAWAWTPFVNSQHRTVTGTPPSLPVEAMEGLATVIEYMDSESAAYLALLLAKCHTNSRRMLQSSKPAFHMMGAVTLQWLADEAESYAWFTATAYRPEPSDAKLRAAFEAAADHSLKHFPNVTEPWWSVIEADVKDEAEGVLTVVALARRMKAI